MGNPILKFKKLEAKYSFIYRAWYLPYNKDNELKLKQHFKSIHFVPTDKLIQNKINYDTLQPLFFP